MDSACPAVFPQACAPASLFTALVLSTLKFDGRRQHEQVAASPGPGGDYDFVVVGGGSAGCVVASRLSENPNWRVLLLEAGPEEPLLTEVPAFNRLLLHTEVDWQFQTQPSGWDPGQYVPRGRTLGGSSAINGMLYSRGSAEDYDDWARRGNQGWAYKDVLPFFKKSENNRGDDVDRELHGRGGPLDVGHFPYRDENVDVILEAFAQAGVPFNRDHTGRRQGGSTLLQFTQRDGHRRSSNRAFIEPVRRLRPNLSVRSQSLVRRVLFKGKQAVGVEVDGPHGRRVVRARREVIVSAGAMQSPWLLMLSGVGPRDHLRQAGIPVVHDLPHVGRNLKDHLTTMLTVNYTVTRTATERVDTLPQRLADWQRYNEGAGGPLAATGVRQVAAFLRAGHQGDAGAGAGAGAGAASRPNIHIEVIGQLTGPQAGSRCANCTRPGEDSVWYNQFRLSPVFLHPRYSGQIRLNATSPWSLPLVFLNISLGADEVPTWVSGFRAAASLNATKAFREAGVVLDTPPIPACPDAAPASDAYWACAGREGAQTWGHLTGSCRMGRGPGDSVVDAQLRVHGVRGLRVVDASVMPDLPSGNTNGPTIMIGEKGADMIRRAHCGACRQRDEEASAEAAAAGDQP